MKHSWFDVHMQQAWRSTGRALYVTSGVFIGMVALTHLAGAVYIAHLTDQTAREFQLGIAQDIKHLKEEGDVLARNEQLRQFLQAGDRASLQTLLQEEKQNRNIGLLGVADARGVIVTRTKSVGVIGDNVFLVNPVGRRVAQGLSVESIEAPRGFDINQILINTGRPIWNGSEMVGALFANYLTDDAYATQFRERFLHEGVEVVFYNREGGIYGNTFSDEETRHIIHTYFNPGSRWLQGEESRKTVAFPDGSLYVVENIVFPGLEGSPGGALLFIPRHDFSPTAQRVTAILVVLVFIGLVTRYHLHTKGEERGWRYYVLISAASGACLVLVWAALQIERNSYVQIQRSINPLYNSTIRLQPEYGIYEIGAERQFTVVVDTGDEPINTVQIALQIDPSIAELKAFNLENSECNYVIEQVIDATKGTATLACALLRSQGQTGLIKIADIVLEPRKAGVLTIDFDQTNTRVLANDGLGTDVLRMTQAGSYRIDTFDPALFTTSTTDGSARSFVVFAPSHPNQSRWYNTDTARFVWLGKPNAVYKYAFDTNPDTIPTTERTTRNNSVALAVPGDGIFYFHLQLATGGPVAHYRIQSDNTPPTLSSIRFSSDNIVAGEVLRVQLESDDTGSGVQKNYYVNFGNGIFVPAGPQLFIPLVAKGNQKVTFRIYDNAGNYTEQERMIRVSKQR